MHIRHIHAILLGIPLTLFAAEAPLPPSQPVMVKTTDGNPLFIKQTVIEISPIWKAMLARNQQSKQSRSIESQMSAAELENLVSFLKLIEQQQLDIVAQKIETASVPDLCLLYCARDYLQIDQLPAIESVLQRKIMEQNNVKQFIDDETYCHALATLPAGLQKQLGKKLIEENPIINDVLNSHSIIPEIACTLAPQWNATETKLAYTRYSILYIYDISTHKKTAIQMSGTITMFQWHPTESHVIGCIDGHDTIALWNVLTTRKINTIMASTEVLTFAWNPHNPDILAYLDKRYLVLYDIATNSRSILCDLPVEVSMRIKSISWSPHNDQLLVEHAYNSFDIWNTYTKTIDDTYKHNLDTVQWHPFDSKKIVVHMSRGGINIIDLTDLDLYVHILNELHPIEVQQTAWNCHTKTLAVGKLGSIYLYPNLKGHTLTSMKSIDLISTVTWHPTIPDLLITTARHYIELWNTTTGGPSGLH